MGQSTTCTTVPYLHQSRVEQPCRREKICREMWASLYVTSKDQQGCGPGSNWAVTGGPPPGAVVPVCLAVRWGMGPSINNGEGRREREWHCSFPHGWLESSSRIFRPSLNRCVNGLAVLQHACSRPTAENNALCSSLKTLCQSLAIQND